MKVFFNDGYVAPGHGADTTRKSDQIAAVLATGHAPSRRPPPPPPHGHRVRDHQLGSTVTGRS